MLDMVAMEFAGGAALLVSYALGRWVQFSRDAKKALHRPHCHCCEH